MAIPKLLKDLAIVSKLGDNPGSDNGLSTSAFRATFDEAALLIQSYINNELLPALNMFTNPAEGLDMTGPINMNGQALGGLNAPTEDDQAVNWGTAKTVTVSKVLSADLWEEDATAGFIQSVVVDGLTDQKKCKAYPDAPATLDEKLALMEETPKVKHCTRDGDTLTFEAWEEKPEIDIPIVVEVYV